MASRTGAYSASKGQLTNTFLSKPELSAMDLTPWAEMNFPHRISARVFCRPHRECRVHCTLCGRSAAPPRLLLSVYRINALPCWPQFFARPTCLCGGQHADLLLVLVFPLSECGRQHWDHTMKQLPLPNFFGGSNHCIAISAVGNLQRRDYLSCTPSRAPHTTGGAASRLALLAQFALAPQASITPTRAQSDRPWRQPPRPAPSGISAGTEGSDTLVRVDTFRLTGYSFNHLLPRRTRRKAPAGFFDGSKIFS